MGRQRVWVAIVFIPLFYALVRYLPPAAFYLFVAAGTLLALREFFAMHFEGGRRPEVLLGTVAGGLVLLAFSVERVQPDLGYMSVLVIAVLLGELAVARDLGKALADGAIVLTGVMYVVFLLGYLIPLRKFEGGPYLVFFVFLVTWATDTGAYYTGKLTGRRPLAPRVSPNKTVEGAVGGLVFSLGASLAARAWFLPEMTLMDAWILGLGLGILGQLGDLTESLFKRGAGIKDSGGLIPAHGGILDRVDSLIFTAPAFYHYLVWVKHYGRGINV